MSETQSDIKTLWEEQFDEIFETNKVLSDMEVFLSIVGLMLDKHYGAKLSELYNIVGDMDKFTKIINVFSGMQLDIPERDSYKECFLVSLAYFYRKIKGYSWEQTKEQLPMQANLGLISGKRIADLDRRIEQELKDFFKGKIDG